MKYQIGKHYSFDGIIWLCTAITKAYASFESIDKPRRIKMVRACNEV